jgi:hypothetical protein
MFQRLLGNVVDDLVRAGCGKQKMRWITYLNTRQTELIGQALLLP